MTAIFLFEENMIDTFHDKHISWKFDKPAFL